MIDDLDKSIQNLLELTLPRVRNSEVEISFHQPNRDWKRDKAALNFFLYDLRQNPILRQQGLQETLNRERAQAARAQQRVLLQRAPLRFDCFYMVTAWNNNYPVEEHRLLSECLLALARYPVLNRYERDRPEPPTNGNGTAHGTTLTPVDEADFLVGTLRNLTVEIPTRLAEHDVLTNPAEVWGSLDNSMKVAFSYVVTLPLNPWQPIVAPAVTTIETRFFQTAGSTASKEDAP